MRATIPQVIILTNGCRAAVSIVAKVCIGPEYCL